MLRSTEVTERDDTHAQTSGTREEKLLFSKKTRWRSNRANAASFVFLNSTNTINDLLGYVRGPRSQRSALVLRPSWHAYLQPFSTPPNTTTSVDAACDLKTRLTTVLSTSLIIKALLFVSSTKVLHGLVSLLSAFVCLGGGGRGPSTKTPLCVSSAGWRTSAGSVGVEEEKNKNTKQEHRII